MSQVNLLAIDLAQSVDNTAVSTKNLDQGEQQSASFSAMMAKHQEQESGKQSQQSGKASHQEVTDEQTKLTDTETKSAEPKADKATRSESKTPIKDDTSDLSDAENKEQTQLSVDENIEENIEQKPAIEGNTSSRLNTADDIAKQLLSFIAASDEVSTETIDGKFNATQEGRSQTDKTIGIKADFTDKKHDLEGKVASSSSTTSEVINKTVANSDQTNTSEITTEPEKTSKETSELKVTLDKTNAASITAADKINSAENLTLTQTAKSVKEAIWVDNSLATDGVATAIDEKLKSPSVNPAQVAATDANIIEEKVADEEIPQAINKDAKASKNSNVETLITEQSAATKGKADKVDTSQVQTEPQGVTPVVTKDSEISKEEVKNVAKSDQTAERAISQTINNRGSLADNQTADSQGQSKEQSTKQQHMSQQPLEKSDAEFTKETQQVAAKQAFEIDVDEKTTANMAEKSAVQSQVRETSHHQVLSQQSLHYAEEQAIQSSIVKATADSISVQSAKSAFNIQAETISINRKDFVDAVKDKVMVMINQKIRQLEIRLDPPELGSMHVKLNLQNEQAAVNFVVQNQQAKEALEQNIDKLKDMLAQTGVDVGDANIEQRNQQANEGEETAQGQSAKDAMAGQDTDVEELTLSAANLYKASASGVDYYA
ncbi:flagellar hook-length control protein FliK [Thalassotalea sp. SU-HH00458]|uniref:flagellar hook-length control protein FliK n=1 Tax=Thalassotalea sp. SU-HH00458 TaxID=3127657 RepID=UPI0031075B81